MSYPDNYVNQQSVVTVSGSWTGGGVPCSAALTFTLRNSADGVNAAVSSGDFGDLITAIQGWISDLADPATVTFDTPSYPFTGTEDV